MTTGRGLAVAGGVALAIAAGWGARSEAAAGAIAVAQRGETGAPASGQRQTKVPRGDRPVAEPSTGRSQAAEARSDRENEPAPRASESLERLTFAGAGDLDDRARVGPVSAGEEPAAAAPRPAGLPTVPLPAGTAFERHVVGDESAVAAGEAGRVIYSNTRGRVVIRPGASNLLADDISTTAPHGCELAYLEFEVVGRVDPDGTGGPFGLTMALYDRCPGAVPASERDAAVLPGTQVELSFPDDRPRTIVFAPPADTKVVLPNSFWLGLTFSRANAGPVMGAPATTGFSGDVFDFPGVHCGANLGDFPDQPHGSFNVRVVAREGCAPVNVQYKASRLSGPAVNPGPHVWVVDDLTLLTDDCRMVGYEVGIRGAGRYEFELRETCSGPAIPGTQRTEINFSTDGTPPRVLRFAFDPPVPLPRDPWFAVRVHNSGGGPINTGRLPVIGSSEGLWTVVDGELACSFESVGSLDVTVLCESEAPTGACCDMYVPECIGGPDDGRPCRQNDPCESPGTCEVVCRELPEINCTFPRRGSTHEPRWVEGAACSPEPFEHRCGESACCTPNDTCENLTRTECDAVEPVDGGRRWQQGRFCGQGARLCPWSACIQGNEAPCDVSHDTPGCATGNCCGTICNLDAYCCFVEWDDVCVRLAIDECTATLRNDTCVQAVEVSATDRILFTNAAATADDSDPRVCCHRDIGSICHTGPLSGEPCKTDSDCGAEATCGPALQKATSTVWFKFVATHPVAELNTCSTDSTGDSLIQVFAAGDPATPEDACQSLVPMGCVDDSPGCGESSRHGRVCLTGLVPGETYYVMVGSKRFADAGILVLEVDSLAACQNAPAWNADDCNNNGMPDGCEVSSASVADCDRSGVPDECELRDGLLFDCDRDGLTDACEPPVAPLTAPGTSPQYGSDVAIDGDVAFVGDSPYPLKASLASGTIFVFRRQRETWNLVHAIVSPDGDPTDPFAASFVLSEHWVWIAVPPRSYYDLGSVYVAPRSQDDVGTPTLFDPDLLYRHSGFGAPIAAHGHRAVIAAIPDEGAIASVYHWTVARGWYKEADLVPTEPVVGSTTYDVGIWGNWVVLTRRYNDPIKLFRREGSLWLEQPDLDLDLAADSEFTVAIQGGVILAMECRPSEVDDVAVQVFHSFRREGRAWIRESGVTGAGYCQFQPTLSLNGDVAVGPGAHVYRRVDGVWTSEGPLRSPPASSPSAFPSAWSVSGRRVLKGLSMDPYAGRTTRSAYVLQIAPSDCNHNGRPDDCDLREALARDCDGNAVPDECDGLAPFDADFDGDVDLRDFAGLQTCFSPGDGLSPASCCHLHDESPADGQVNAADFAGFYRAFAGPYGAAAEPGRLPVPGRAASTGRALTHGPADP